MKDIRLVGLPKKTQTLYWQYAGSLDIHKTLHSCGECGKVTNRLFRTYNRGDEWHCVKHKDKDHPYHKFDYIYEP